MAVLNTYRCETCESVCEGWSNSIPACCGQRMQWMPVKVNTPEWGGPQQHIHLRDEPFSSRSELNDWVKKEGLELSPSADKHGGARNEDHLNLGKKFSYRGAPSS